MSCWCEIFFCPRIGSSVFKRKFMSCYSYALSPYNILAPANGTLVLANTFSGAIIALDEQHEKLFQNVIKGDYSATEFVQALVRCGILVRDIEDQAAEVIKRVSLLRSSSDTLRLTIAPTLACNFSCPYCYESNKCGKVMSPSVLEHLLVFIKPNLARAKQVQVTWYGGEPLLQLDSLERFANSIKNEMADGQSYSSSIVTNGLLLTQENALRLKACDVSLAQVTVDGGRAAHDSRRKLSSGGKTYDKIMDNIVDACDILSVVIRVNLDRSNADSVDELFSDLLKHGLKGKVWVYPAAVDECNGYHDSLGHCYSTDEFGQIEIEFFQSAIRHGFGASVPIWNFPRNICGAISSSSYVIDPEGNICKCWDEIGLGDACVGDVFGGLRPESPNALDWESYSLDSQKCSMCPVFPICMGGCPKYLIRGSGHRCGVTVDSIRQRALLKWKESACSLH